MVVSGSLYAACLEMSLNLASSKELCLKTSVSRIYTCITSLILKFAERKVQAYLRLWQLMPAVCRSEAGERSDDLGLYIGMSLLFLYIHL